MEHIITTGNSANVGA